MQETRFSPRGLLMRTCGRLRCWGAAMTGLCEPEPGRFWVHRRMLTTSRGGYILRRHRDATGNRAAVPGSASRVAITSAVICRGEQRRPAYAHRSDDPAGSPSRPSGNDGSADDLNHDRNQLQQSRMDILRHALSDTAHTEPTRTTELAAETTHSHPRNSSNLTADTTTRREMKLRPDRAPRN